MGFADGVDESCRPPVVLPPVSMSTFIMVVAVAIQDSEAGFVDITMAQQDAIRLCCNTINWIYLLLVKETQCPIEIKKYSKSR